MVRLYSPDIILGSKRHPLSEVEYPFLRRVYSWGYQQVVRLGFRLNIKDTQTGIKLVRRDVLSAVLPRMLEKRFAFRPRAVRNRPPPRVQAVPGSPHPAAPPVHQHRVMALRLPVATGHDGHLVAGVSSTTTTVTRRRRRPARSSSLIDPIVLRGSTGAAAGSTGAADTPPGSADTPAGDAGTLAGGRERRRCGHGRRRRCRREYGPDERRPARPPTRFGASRPGPDPRPGA